MSIWYHAKHMRMYIYTYIYERSDPPALCPDTARACPLSPISHAGSVALLRGHPCSHQNANGKLTLFIHGSQSKLASLQQIKARGILLLCLAW